MPRGNPGIRVLTLNVRYDNAEDADNWSRRRGLVAAVWEQIDPDLVFLQEVLPHQQVDVQNQLPGFEFFGTPRDLDQGESVPIGYRRTRFSSLDHGFFWVSETPDVPGAFGWDAACPRVVTWARLADNTTGWKLLVASVHLDHQGTVARNQGTRLIVERLGALAEGCAVLWGGDFNAEPNDPLHQTLAAAGYQDLVAPQCPPSEDYSFHGFDQEPRALIDYLYAGPGVLSLAASRQDLRPLGLCPSDHVPVVADVDLRGWVVFDMDGTLFPTETVTIPACQRGWEAFGLEPPAPEAIRARIGEPFPEFIRHLAPKLSSLDRTLLERQVDLFELDRIRLHGVLFPGIPEALRNLRAQGYRLALCSLGSPEYLETILEATGTTALFEVVLGAPKAPVSKAELLGARGALWGPRVVFVGDRTVDFDAARTLGWPSVGVEWGYGGSECDLADAKVSQVADLVGAINGFQAPYRGRP